MKLCFRKLLLTALTVALVLSLAGCGAKKQSETQAQAGFKPRLDSQIKASVNVAGHYKNFEALEAEFNLFNQHYPNVELNYIYLDKKRTKAGAGCADRCV